MSTTPTENKAKQTLQITCIVTGRSRLTNQKYLDAKAQRLGTDASEVVKHYVCRPAMKLLRAGKTLAEVRTTLGTEGTVADVSEKRLKRAVALNGKHGEEKAEASTQPATAVAA